MEDLIEKYGSRKDLMEKISKRQFFQYHTKFKIGDIISFYGGYNDDIQFKSKIIGFSNDGGIFVIWDCYWLPIYDNDIRKIVKLTN
jgi:hypothetical protein